MKRSNIDSVIRSLRRVNIQCSCFGATVAIRFGLSESDIETLETLIERGATTAGRLSELTGLTSGAITRVIDRLEQAGYVRRVPDPADRRRVIVEVVTDKIAAVQETLDRISTASAEEIGRYSEAQLELINDFLTKMEHITKEEAATLRDDPAAAAGSESTSEHVAPIGGLSSAKLLVRSGLSTIRLRAGRNAGELYRAAFEGATPQVRLRDGRVIVQYRGLPFDWRKRVASFGLNQTIPWVVEIVGGVERVEADMRDVDVRRFSLVGGSDRVQLEFGRPVGELEVRIVGGATSIRVERPADIPVRLKIAGGTKAVNLDGTGLGSKGGQTTLDSVDWAKATNRLAIEVVGGSKSIDVVGRPG